MCVNFREPRGCGRGPSAARIYLAELRPLTTLETTEGPKKMWFMWVTSVSIYGI